MMGRGYDSQVIEEQRRIGVEELERLRRESKRETARLEVALREQNVIREALWHREAVLCDDQHRDHTEEIRRSYAEAMGHCYAPPEDQS